MEKCVYVIIDGQAGSCGKGKVIGEFALEQDVKAAVSNNMPNAGHTFVLNGKKRVFRTLPVSAVNKNTELFIGPEAEIDMEVLEEEYEQNKDLLEGREIIVHPMVPLVEERHREWERKHIKTGSTFKGCAGCKMEKISRNPNLKFFTGYKNMIVSWDQYYDRLWQHIMNADKILLESAQGCDLDLNHSNHYPFVTSRQVSVAQLFADSGIATDFKKEVIMVIRPFPIRISNKVYDGTNIYSGNYGSSQELSWMQINIGAFLGQYPTMITQEDINQCWSFIERDYTEYTTVTKQKRRVFNLDIQLLKHNVRINMPNYLYLNFFQHLGYDYENLRGNAENNFGEGIIIDDYQKEYLNWLETETKTPVYRLGTGPDLKDYIDLNNGYAQKLLRKR